MGKKFWKCAAIRAIKTVAQAAVALIGVNLALHEVEWVYVLSVAILAGILSILNSVATIPDQPIDKAEGTD